jgi:hypothetical protein
MLEALETSMGMCLKALQNSIAAQTPQGSVDAFTEHIVASQLSDESLAFAFGSDQFGECKVFPPKPSWCVSY